MPAKLTIEEVKENIKNKYPHIEVLSNKYIAANKKLKVVCKICNHEWEVSYNNLRDNGVCENCNTIKRNLDKLIEIKNEVFKINPNIEILNDVYFGFNTRIKCKCKVCNKEWNTRYVELTYSKTGCPKCGWVNGAKKCRETNLKKSKSFEQWCYDNLYIDYANEILSRWDAEKNGCLPSEVCHSSNGLSKSVQGYWFRCLKHPEHKSELKIINAFVTWFNKQGWSNVFDCKQCSSFGQWCLDNNRQDILDRWDYELNGSTPMDVSYANNKKYWFKCPRGIHESEFKGVNHFTNRGGLGGELNCIKCHSFAQWGIDNVCKDFLERYWDYGKNVGINPWEISCGSTKTYAWMRCQNEHPHESHYVRVSHFSFSGSRCPKCSHSKGEKRIEKWLNKNHIIHIPQKEFEGLLGIGGRNLSYDFYLSEQNLLIEYQGEFHDGTVSFQTEEDFEIQKEHDRRKLQYAKLHNIDLLEIWYWDFNNIEEILNNTIKEYITDLPPNTAVNT